MKKELKDYLHFYLGCKCKGKSGTMIYTLIDVGLERSSLLLDKFGNECVIFDFKPVLRRLSDMTEDEAMEMLLYVPNQDVRTFKEVKKQVKQSTERGFGPSFSADQFSLLLSKHFDLFGLIDVGLAIDATTIKAEI